MKWSEALDRVKNLAVHEVEWTGYVREGLPHEDMSDSSIGLIAAIGGCDCIEEVVEEIGPAWNLEYSEVALLVSSALVCPVPFKFFVADGALDIVDEDSYGSPDALTWDEIVKLSYDDLLELMGVDDPYDETPAPRW